VYSVFLSRARFYVFISRAAYNAPTKGFRTSQAKGAAGPGGGPLSPSAADAFTTENRHGPSRGVGSEPCLGGTGVLDRGAPRHRAR